jgi:two-component system sensor histidine kinase DesK
VNNVIKHADASRLSVQLFTNKSTLILMVEDNGVGINNGYKEGHGLLNIQTRLNTIKGEVNYEAGQHSGTLVTVRIILD